MYAYVYQNRYTRGLKFPNWKEADDMRVPEMDERT